MKIAQYNSVRLLERRFIRTYDAVMLYLDAIEDLNRYPEFRTCPIAHRWITQCATVLDHILADALMKQKEREMQQYHDYHLVRWLFDGRADPYVEDKILPDNWNGADYEF